MRQLVNIKPEECQKKAKLHDDILDILFAHKSEIYKKLCDIKGLYFIDHIAITISNPENEIVVFSLTPSVEYNVIIKDLWKHDIAFRPDEFITGDFAWWDSKSNIYTSEVRKIKEENHHFSVGFNLYKKVEKFKFIYSFASRKEDENIRSYYENLMSELFHLGDYGYKLIRDIYLNYCGDYIPPQITKDILVSEKPYLRLVFSKE
jgi:hypothetical protein